MRTLGSGEDLIESWALMTSLQFLARGSRDVPPDNGRGPSVWFELRRTQKGLFAGTEAHAGVIIHKTQETLLEIETAERLCVHV